jgi:hypothetical protein
MAIEEQVRAYGGPQFQLVQQVMNRFAEAVEQSKVDVVPKITMGTNGSHGSGLIEGLLGTMLTEKLSALAGEASKTPRDPHAQALRDELFGRMKKGEGPTKS